MSRIDLVKAAVDEQLNDSYDLLAMRMLFPPDHVEVKIDQEIKDLYVYPERLDTGYRDEWRAIATRALFRNAFGDHWRPDEENLERYLVFLSPDEDQLAGEGASVRASWLAERESGALIRPYCLKDEQ